MTLKTIAPLFAAVALAFAAPAHAGPCDGLAGKELKNCQKAAKKRAKQDARSVPFKPSDLHAALSTWDDEGKNPFATEDYRVRVTSTDLAPVDDYLAKAYKLHATVVASKYVVDQAGKGSEEAMRIAPELIPLLSKVPDVGQQLVTDGEALAADLPSQLAPADAMKAPKGAAAISDAVSAIRSAVEEAPQVLVSLKGVAEDPSAAAATATDMATEAATEAADDAVEAAAEKVEEAVE